MIGHFMIRDFIADISELCTHTLDISFNLMVGSILLSIRHTKMDGLFCTLLF